MGHSLACCIESDLISSPWDKSVGHVFASAVLSTYGEATRALMLPGGWNSRCLLQHHAPHASSSKGCRRQMWAITWTQEERSAAIGL